MDNKSQENVFPKLLSQTPIGEDKFSGKAQENVASAIFDIIKAGRYKTIGIDGSWGTGKSNLVEIIRKKMPKYEFLIYDAWEHQEDYQRRSIIEELVNFLSDRKMSANFADETSIFNEKDKMLGSTVKRKTTSIPTFKVSTIFILLALIFIPFANYSTSQNVWSNNVKLSVSVLPIIFFMLSIACLFYKKKGKTFVQLFSEFICLYKDKEIESNTIEYTNLENPSTATFRKFIKSINYTLANEKNLVIVIDNIDRLPIKKVKELWSSIRVFFPESYNNDNINDKITVIVPFDRKHINKAFKWQSDCDDLINKTFNIVFRVSLPVLKDWENFFKDNWEEAFGVFDSGENNRGEFDKVRRIYDELTEVITPRSIIAFINECVVLKIISGEEHIKYRYIAIFAKCKNDILKNPTNNIADRSYLKKRANFHENDTDLDKSIAALTFQVSLEKSLEVAFARPLKNALESNIKDDITKISKSPAFGSLLGKLITKVENLPNAILALSEIDVKAFGNSEVRENIWDDLYDMNCFYDKNHIVSKQTIEEYQIILLKNIKNDHKILYAKEFISFHLNNKDDFSLPKFIMVLNNLDKILQKREINIFKKLSEKDISDIDGILEKVETNNLSNIKFIPLILEVTTLLPLYSKRLEEGVASSYNSYPEFKDWVERSKEIIKPIKLENLSIQNLRALVANISMQEEFIYDLFAIGIIKFPVAEIRNMPNLNSMVDNIDDKLIEKIAKVIGFYINYGDLLLKIDQLGNLESYKKLCRYLTDHDEYEHKADLINMLPKLNNICSVCELQIEKIAKALDTNSLKCSQIKNVKDTITIDFIENTIDIKENKFIDVCRKRLGEYLLGLDKEIWKTVITDKLDTYEINAGMLVNFQWNSVSVEAIREFLLSKAKDKNIALDLEKWYEFLKIVEKSGNDLSALFRDIRDSCFKEGLSVAQFIFWGELFFEYAVEKRPIPKETLRKFLPVTLLDDDKCLDIIIKNSNTVLAIYNAAKEENVEFTNKVKACAKKDNSKCVRLAEVLKIQNIEDEITENFNVE